ncbi:MAG: thioredoxin family protein [Pirellulales bacterium]
MVNFTLSILLQAAAVAAGGQQDYATAYKATQESGRPLVVLVGAEWCPGCRTMKHSVIPQLEKEGGLANVAFAYVNTDDESRLAGQLMQGSTIPQLILYHKTETGWKRQRIIGARAPSEVQTFIEEATGAAVPKISSRQ